MVDIAAVRCRTLTSKSSMFKTLLLLAAAAGIFAGAARAQDVPENLRPPATEKLLLQVHAKGAQIYVCRADGAKFAWTLKAPDAQLFDKDGKLFGKHFAGPTWEANDGSRVTGKAIANAPSPDGHSVPWLLVKVVDRSGEGTLAHVTSIQRINTNGGLAPASGCDSKAVDLEVRAEYSADYRFFVPQ